MMTFPARRGAMLAQPCPHQPRLRFAAKAGALLSALALASASMAQGADEAPRDRFVSSTVYGNDPCPGGADDEIVVCGREPESERYRIPKALRETKYQPPAQSWTSRVHTLDDVSQASRPNSCSVVGTGGQTGCFAHALEQWFAERR